VEVPAATVRRERPRPVPPELPAAAVRREPVRDPAPDLPSCVGPALPLAGPAVRSGGPPRCSRPSRLGRALVTWNRRPRGRRVPVLYEPMRTKIGKWRVGSR
jgi:hypothetical protein